MEPWTIYLTRKRGASCYNLIACHLLRHDSGPINVVPSGVMLGSDWYLDRRLEKIASINKSTIKMSWYNIQVIYSIRSHTSVIKIDMDNTTTQHLTQHLTYTIHIISPLLYVVSLRHGLSRPPNASFFYCQPLREKIYFNHFQC